MERNVRGFGKTQGKAFVEDGLFKVLKGSICAPTKREFVPDVRKNARIENDVLMEDIMCSSPSSAGWVIIGRSNNGWAEWKNERGEKIDIFRNNDK